MDTFRRKTILEFFISHFIEIAKKSNEFQATAQAKFYLQHTKNLNQLLEEMEGGDHTNSYQYKNKIKEIEDAIGSFSGTSLPNTPNADGRNASISNEKIKAIKLQLDSNSSKLKLNLVNDSSKPEMNLVSDSSKSKMNLANDSSKSILKNKQDTQLKVKADVHVSREQPSSSNIRIIDKKIKPTERAIEVEEAVMTESTDF